MVLGGKLLKCDLCEGDPWCVKFCPVKAVDFVEVSKLDMKMKRVEMKKMIEVAAAERRMT
jgi:Fe-S-cluster-containing hydrogenase component 2